MKTPYIPLLVSTLPRSLAPFWGLLAIMASGVSLLIHARLSELSNLEARVGLGLALVGGLSWSALMVQRWIQRSRVLGLLVETELITLLEGPRTTGLSRARLRRTLDRRFPGWAQRQARTHRFEESF